MKPLYLLLLPLLLLGVQHVGQTKAAAQGQASENLVQVYLRRLGNIANPHSQRGCLMCRFSVGLVNHALRTKRGADQVERIANNFCLSAKIELPTICSHVTKLFNQEITKVLSYGIITPDQVCGLLSNNTCGHFRNPLDDWKVNLDASASLLDRQAILARAANQVEILEEKEDEDGKPFRVIHISDTHVDLNYAPKSVSVCAEPLCCRNSSTQDTNRTGVEAGLWGSYGQCDVPVRTFESALKELNKTISSANDIKYIIWTGDIQPHDIWEQSRESANAIYDQVFGKIFEYLPNVKILPTFGNHEMIPVDSFSPSNLDYVAGEDSPVWLYKKLDSFWSRWLPTSTEKTIVRDGFYAANLRKGLKLISLNTNFCHSKNFWLFINSKDPGNQLQWLVHELQMSELLNEKVHIIGHIPPGSEDCLKVWSRNYNEILRHFSSTLTGQFFGHTHNNEFEMFYKLREKPKVADKVAAAQPQQLEPLSVGFVGPSITTFIDLNPSFRIYTIAPAASGYLPLDFETIFMNLTRANLDGEKEPEWQSAGSFAKRFSLKDTSPVSMHNFLLDLVEDLKSEELAGTNTNQLIEVKLGSPDEEQDDRLFELYKLFNSFSDAATRQKFNNITVTGKREFICKLFTGQAHDQTACNEFIYNKQKTFSHKKE